MDLNKISNFIKAKRKELNLTQEELAEKLFVTEKAVSRWETGRGTPDISLLIPLSKALKVEIPEILNGEENKKNKNDIEKLIEYNELTKKSKFNFKIKLIILLYVLSILFFLSYLRVEYNPNIELNYFIRLFLVVISSILIVIGNRIYANNYVEKIEDKMKVDKLSKTIVFIYYIILLFNMVIFARYSNITSYNIIPFASITNLITNGNLYTIVINLFGNLLIFMPLEYFIIELFKVNKFKQNLLLSFIIILMIETSQFILKIGVFDIDDIIICTFGMMIFYVIYNSIKNIRRKYEEKNNANC